MKNNALISVILPLYNEPESLAKQAIDSILTQTYSKLEIILLLDNPGNDILRTFFQSIVKKTSVLLLL